MTYLSDPVSAVPKLSADDGTDVEAATTCTAGVPAPKLNGMPAATTKQQTRTVTLQQHLKVALGWDTGSSQTGGPGSFQNGFAASGTSLFQAICNKPMMQQQQPPQQQQQSPSGGNDRGETSSAKCSSPLAHHAHSHLFGAGDSRSKRRKCSSAIDHQQSSRQDIVEDDNVAAASAAARDGQGDCCSSSRAAGSRAAAAAGPSRAVSHLQQHIRSSSRDHVRNNSSGHDRPEAATQDDHQHPGSHDHSQMRLLPQHVPSDEHVALQRGGGGVMEPSMRLPSSFSFSLTDLYPEPSAGAASTPATDLLTPVPHEFGRLQATSASAIVTKERDDKLRSWHGSRTGGSRGSTRRNSVLFRHASTAVATAAQDRLHCGRAASSAPLTLRRRTTAADEDQRTDAAQPAVGESPVRQQSSELVMHYHPAS
jgi:hypothetical protein